MYNELNDEYYMKKALLEAEKSYKINEVPIGAVIVYTGIDNTRTRKNKYIECVSKLNKRYKIGDIIAKGYNKRNKDNLVTSHAEINAINKANKKLRDYRLEGCTMYVTLEPCPMCAGALVNSRIDRVVIGTKSDKSGSGGSIVNILNNDKFNHKVRVTYNILEEECSMLLKKYFKTLRKEVD